MNKKNSLEMFSSRILSFGCAVAAGVMMSVPLTATAASYPYESLPGSAITDNSCVDTDITVTDSFTVSDLNVGLNLTHTYRGDLTVSLLAPDNTTAILFDRHGGSGDNLDISLDGSHTSLMANVGSGFQDTAPPFYDYEYKPGNSDALSVFNGKSSVGTWALRVCDDGSGDIGTVNRVLLTFQDDGAGNTVAGTGARAFEARQTAEFRGNFEYVGNTLLQCTSGCVTDNHNQSPMSYVDIDGDATTFNSSSAEVSLPADAEITWAGLYWGGVAGSSTSTYPGLNATPDAAAKHTVKFKVPGGSYQDIVANVIDTVSDEPMVGWSAYQAFADVTTAVKFAGAGSYTIANAQLDSGGGSPGTAFTGPNGGWNLVVIYKSGSEKYRRITLWDGYDFVYFSDNNYDFTIDSILTPPVAGFETEVAFTCYDGEVTDGAGGGDGDFVALSNVSNKLSNALNPATNVCNGTISKNGDNVTDRNPALTQNWAFDVDRFSSNGLPANATSVNAIFGSENEGIWFGNIILSSEIFAPPVAEKSFQRSAVSANTAEAMTITLQNTNASGSLDNIAFSDTYPAGLMNVGSNVVESNTCNGSLTAGGNTSSLSFSGGTLNAGESCSITVRVAALTSAVGSTLENCTSPISTTSTGSEGESACASILVTNGSYDYGDAPASYGDAAHVIDSSLYLGDTIPDAEPGSQYSYNAYGDGEEVVDGSGTWYLSGDEDGAPSQPVSSYIPLFPVLKMTAMSYSADFKVNNAKSVAANLYGWIDFDHDGVFSADEAATVSVPPGSLNATVSLNWNVPVDIDLGTTFIRLRLTTDSSVTTSTPDSVASDGEVEDFVLAVAIDIPPDSNAISIATNETPQACQVIVFSDDFDDLAIGGFIGPNRGGATVTIRDWTVTGGGADTYARTDDGTGVGLGTSIYLGNGAVRRVSPAIGSGFTFDSNGRMTTVLDAVELRDNADDQTPGTTISSYASTSDWGPEPIAFSRSFATEVGKSYRLYFKALPEDVGGSFAAGVMRLDMPGGSIHFKIPGSNEGVIDYAVEFTATSTTSSITFVNYGHVNSGNGDGWCDPASEYNNNPWCTVGGATNTHGNELIIDNVAVTESACAQGSISGVVYVDEDGNDNYAPATDTVLSAVTVSLLNNDTGDLVASVSTDAGGAYSFNNLADNITYTVSVDDSDSDLPAGAVTGTPNPLNGLSVAGNVTLANQDFGFDLVGGVCPVGYAAEMQPGHAESVALDQTVAHEARSLGAPADAGTNPDTANGGVGVAALVGNGDILIVDLGEIVEAGSDLELSLTRNNNNGRVEIATSVDNATYDVLGTYGNSGTLSTGTQDSLERLLVTVPAASARYVRFTRQSGAVWVDAVSYSNICTAPSSASSCGPVMTSIMPSGAINHADNVSRSAVIGFDYALRGTSANTPNPVQIASASEVGTIWGKAYDEADKALYVSSFLRRHAGLSPHGLGAIYKIDVTDASYSSAVGAPGLWMDLNSLTHLGAGATLFPDETSANRGLTGAFSPSRDIWAYNRVGKQGIGGLDLSDDFSTLYAVDMTNRQLLVVDTGTKTVLARHAINDPGCVGGAGDVRPFGVDYLKGDVYVGVTCSGETNQSDNDVDAHVVKLSGNTFTPVVSGAKGYQWSSFWSNDPFGGGSCGSPEIADFVPVITNMQLDENDNMVIGVTSINGFRFGNGNYLPDNSCQTQLTDHETYGYVLRATPSGNNWVLSADELHNGSYGAGFKHFFSDGQYAHWGIGANHSFLGGLAVSSCEGPEVAIINMMDPLDYESGGTRYMRTVDGQHETAAFAGDTALATSTASTLEHYQGIGSTWEKSAGMGDIEFMSSPGVSVDTGSIFGKVYTDSNGNDTYDAATESGIGSVTVSLLNDADGTAIDSTSTAADGSYGFTNLDAGIDYRVVVDVADTDLPATVTLGTDNPLTGVSVTAGLVTADQNFGFDLAVTQAPTAVGEYRFDDCGSGGWALDSSGNNNNATGSITVIDDDFKSYGCTSVRNSGWDLTVPHIPAYELEEGAISILMYDNQTVDTSRLLSKGWDSDARIDLTVKQTTDNQNGTISVNLDGNTIDTGETYFSTLNNGSEGDGEWVHVMVTFGSQGMKLYINGVLKGTNAYTGGMDSAQGAIRMAEPFGYIDEFYILDAQPDDTGVQSIYNNLINNRNLDGSARICNCGSSVASITGKVYLDENGNDTYDVLNSGNAGSLQSDLLALYRFGTGSGNTVFDISGVGGPMNLSIADPSKVTWLSGGGLSVDSNTLLSANADTKLTTALQASNEVTVEAWIKPANLTQSGPARIATLSLDTSQRNLTLGQQGDDYNARLRTSTNNNNGSNPSTTAADSVETELQHVVYTRTAAGIAQVYVNGVLAGSETVDGDLSNLNNSYRFALANELTSNRPWLGEFYKVAVYQRALNTSEISSLYAAGELGGERLLSDVTVSLYDDNGTSGTLTDDLLLDSVSTASDGSYGFYNVALNTTYRIGVDAADADLPIGATIGTTNPLTGVPVTAGTVSADNNFGFDAGTGAFTCTSALYQSVAQPTANSPVQLYGIALNGNTQAITPVGNTSHGISYNAIGYNVLDNRIYGIKRTSQGDTLVSVGADGVATELGVLSQALGSQPGAGDMDDQGNLYVRVNSSDSLFKIDVDTRVVTEIPSSMGAFAVADFAWNSDGLLYGIVSNTGQLHSLNPATGAMVAIGDPDTSLTLFGAQFFDNANNLYAIENATGDLYRFDITDGTHALLASGFSPAAGNDGASCRGEPPVASGSIAGHVYHDDNQNSNYDTGSEAGIGSITVSLYFDNGTPGDVSDDTQVATTESAANGTYNFKGINAAAGLSYRIEVSTTDTDLAGKSSVTTNPLTGVTVTAGNTTTDQNFGFDLLPAPEVTVVGEYRFDDCGGGEWLDDYSVNDNTATGVKKAVHDDGKDYGCTSLSAYRSYVEVPHIPEHEMTGGAVSMLVYDHHNTWETSRLLDKTGAGGSEYFNMKMRRTTDEYHGTFTVDLNGHTIDTGETFFTVTSANDGDLDTDWVHVVFTFGPQGMRLYVDGQLKGTNAHTGGFGQLDSAFTLPYFSGYYDEFYILDGQPNDAQVQTLHDNLLANKNINGSPRTCDCSSSITSITGKVYLDENGNDSYDLLTGSNAGSLQSDLLLLYRFGAGSGSTVYDISGVGSPMNLSIADPSKVTWMSGGGLSVDDSTLLQATADTKLLTALQASNEVTVETWVKPENLTQDGPARMVTFSENTSQRNLTLGQEGDDYEARLRTTTNSNNGNSPETTAADVVDTVLQHVVYTRTAAGVAQIYVDGVLAGSETISGDLSNFDSSHVFALANELTGGRPWLGEFHKVAVYQRALNASEVSGLFAEGAVSGEPLLSDVTVSLYDDNGTGITTDDLLIGDVSTAADGSYGFYNVASGLTYRIEVDAADTDLPAGANIGTTNPLTGVPVVVGMTTGDQNFGFDQVGVQPPFTCDASIYIAKSTSDSVPSQFSSVDTSTSPFTLSDIGNNTHGYNYNALGYRDQDNYLYGIELSTSNLLKVGADGSVVNLGAVSGLPVPSNIFQAYDSGDVFPDGYLYIHEVSTHPEIYKIDVTTTPPQVVETIQLNQAIWLSDFAYNTLDGKVYGIGDQGEKFMIDPSTSPNWTVTTVGSNAPAASYGAAYTDNQGNIYIYKNNPGTFYLVDFGVNGTGTGIMTELSAAPNVAFNDGASCRGAPPVETTGISGTVYTDSNGNDSYDSGAESGLGAVTVALLNDADGGAITTTSTAANGSYSFTGLNAALTYRVEVDVADADLFGQTIGTVNPLTGVGVTVGSMTADQDFGFDAANLSCSLVVITTDDSDNAANNSGSLRDAIECANETAGPNTITFDMPVSESGYDADTGVWTISPSSALPIVTDADTTIAADTQTNAQCAVDSRNITVELDGSNAGAVNAGLEIEAERTIIRGMAVNSFAGVGVYFDVNGSETSNGSSLACSNIGIDAAGDTAKANTSWGVRINTASNITLGGTDASDRNIISGNERSGVFAENADQLLLENNYIGLNQAGTAAIGNGSGTMWSQMGVDIWPKADDPSENVMIRNNVISGNVDFGLRFDRSDNNTVTGNIIGLNAGGTAALGNGSSGIQLKESSNITIGGGTLAERNVISGNGHNGINFNNAGSISDVTIQGNYIGVGADGATDLPNMEAAVGLYNASNITIGGSNAGEGNVLNSTRFGVLAYGVTDGTIRGNTLGASADQTTILDFGDSAIEIRNGSSDWVIGGTGANDGNLIVGAAGNNLGGGIVIDAASNTTVQGNRIGELPDGTPGQNTNNIYALNSADNVLIGGVNADEGNVIAHATQHGLMINSSAAPHTSVSILGNNIYANADHGIDLGGDGVSVNDPGDGDTGPNNLLNHPIIEQIAQNGANVELTYSLNVPAGNYRIEFFDNPLGLDPTGHGEGEVFVGFQSISHAGAGEQLFSFTLAGVTLSDVANLAITATENLGSGAFGVTSEFSGIAYEVSGLVFEDLRYGGGNGRPFGTAGTVGANDVRLEIYDASGQLVSFGSSLNQDGQDGTYSLSVPSGGQYYVRAVSDSVSSTRTGSNGSELGVMTFRTDGVTDVVNNVGGHNPALADAGSNDGSSILDTSTFTFTGGTLNELQAQAVQPVVLVAGSLEGVSFGFNFNTVVNTNASGQGSLLQFVRNNNLLDSTGITQQLPVTVAGDYGADDTVAVFMIPADQLVSDEAAITPAAELQIEEPQIVIDGRVQVANIGSGDIIITGDGATVMSGVYFDEGAEGSVLREVTVSSFNGSGITIHGTGSAGAQGVTVQSVVIADNSQYGILLQNEAVANQIIASTIRDNYWAGISNEAASNNTFSQNSISGNGALGIDLGADGVTDNSNTDAWLNYPEIGSNSSIGTNGTMIVAYDFDLEVSSSTQSYRVEFFSNSVVDSSGHGEGEVYLGYIDVTHPGPNHGEGPENFKGSFNANQPVPENANVSLTLTENLDAGALGGTSEFSGIRNANLSVCTDLLADPDAELVDIVLDENSSEITYLEALDADGNPVTYTISGGADGERFVIDPVAPDALFDCITIRFVGDRVVNNRALPVANNSTVRMGAPPRQSPPGNYEAPIDEGNDNVYDLEITVTDSNGNTVTKPLSVVVRDVNEKPVITSAPVVNFLERQDTSVVVIDLQSYDPDAGDAEGSGLTYSISGADRRRFNVDAESGEIRFVDSPDYGAPADENGDNVYKLDVRVADDQGYASSKSLAVTVTDDPDKGGVRVNIKALLQGPYEGNSGLMSDSLRSSGILPLSQPYTSAPFNYQGAETLTSGQVDLSGDDAIVDWLLVELRSSADPTQVVATMAAVLRRNGVVSDAGLDDAGLVFEDAAAGQYYVSLRHRNHLGVMTATPLALSMVPAVVDFTDVDTPVYGEHARLSNGDVAVLWSGDINQDNRLILNGQGSDINVVLSAVLMAPGNEGFNSSYQLEGYNAADLNMDGKVVFMGPSNDANILLGNTLAHPANPNFSANFIAIGGVP